MKKMLLKAFTTFQLIKLYKIQSGKALIQIYGRTIVLIQICGRAKPLYSRTIVLISHP